MSKFDDALATLRTDATDDDVTAALLEAGVSKVLPMHLANARKHLRRRTEQLKVMTQPEPVVEAEPVEVVEPEPEPVQVTMVAVPQGRHAGDELVLAKGEPSRKRSMSVHLNDQVDRQQAARVLRELAQQLEQEGLWSVALDFTSDVTGDSMLNPDWNRTLDGDYSHGWWDVVETNA